MSVRSEIFHAQSSADRTWVSNTTQDEVKAHGQSAEGLSGDRGVPV